MFNAGDYVRHARQGPGRVLEVLPDQVLVKQRNGNVVRVNRGIAEHELELCPADGFVAQLVHRDYNAEALQTHLEDVLIRILRDKRRRSIPISDLKDILMPFLSREGKKWDSWWKSARKQFYSKLIGINSKRKIVERIDSPEAASTMSFDSASPAELLFAVRELQPQNRDQREVAAERAATARALTLMGSSLPLRQSMELLLACCYLAPVLSGEQLDRVREWLIRQDLRALVNFRDLDADTVVCLPALARVSGQSEQVMKVLSHPTAAVAQKAFSILNTERHRKVLRESFLNWLRGDESLLSGFEYYLQPDFLRYIRKQDIWVVYQKVLTIPSPSVTEQQFLNREDIVSILLTSNSLDENVIGTILKSGVVSAQVKERFGQKAAETSGMLQRLVDDVASSPAAALSYLPSVSAEELVSHWTSLLTFLRRSGSADAYSASVARLCALLELSTSEQQHHLLACGCDLWNLAAERGEEAPALVRCVQKLLIHLSSSEVGESKSLLSSALLGVLDERLSAMRLAMDSVQRDNAGLQESLSKSEKDLRRAQNIVDMMKSSDSGEESRIIAKREVIIPFLSLCDDLERRKTGVNGDMIASVFADFQVALNRVGVRRLGDVGGRSEFDPAVHEISEGSIGSGAAVTVLRSGYIMDSTKGSVLLRRALVKNVAR